VRIVFDANVLISAFGSRGLCEPLVFACLGKLEVFGSSHILQEVRTRLNRLHVSPAEADDAVAFLEGNLLLVEPVSVPADACRDPDDLAVLGTAIAANADVLVTGDKDLLSLETIGKTEILSPRDFFGRLKGR
jgi:putative PIN family toxin of toxin-antitoxin system